MEEVSKQQGRIHGCGEAPPIRDVWFFALFPHIADHVPKAVAAIEGLLAKNELKNHEGYARFRKLGEKVNRYKASRHLYLELYHDVHSPDPDDHLLHAACRLLMALQLREESRE